MEEERHLIFGKYETGRLIGKGSFAKVYYGKHIETGQSVAIKVICKDLLKKQIGLMDQIKREISIMKLVRHPNIVELKEVMATRTKIFFVMEYVKGGELFAKVRKGKLKEDVARKYFQQIISAVDFCHSRGVSHRDLKPENLLLDEFGNVKMSDFGLSALPEQLHCDGLLHTTCGTPAYVAPEVLRKHGYDGAKADLWSCGVILFVLLSGFLPFQEENLMRMYCKVFKADYEFPPWISAEARRLISMLLVTDPDRRINISDIMKVPWFRKGFVCPISAGQSSAETPNPLQVTFADNIDGGDNNNSNRFDSNEEEKGVSPQFFNAFELITSMSSGFDLSNLFENKEKAGSMFTSKCSASDIMRKFEEVARGFNFKFAKAKDFKMKLQGVNEGRKGKLEVTAEIFQVAPEVAVVEFVKSAGDTMEYIKFCEEDVRPALKDIVWSWQGPVLLHIYCENSSRMKIISSDKPTSTLASSSWS